MYKCLSCCMCDKTLAGSFTLTMLIGIDIIFFAVSRNLELLARRTCDTALAGSFSFTWMTLIKFGIVSLQYVVIYLSFLSIIIRCASSGRLVH